MLASDITPFLGKFPNVTFTFAGEPGKPDFELPVTPESYLLPDSPQETHLCMGMKIEILCIFMFIGIFRYSRNHWCWCCFG